MALAPGLRRDPGLLCTTLSAIDHVHVDDWNGGTTDFVASTWSLGNLQHTVPVGHQLRLVLSFGHNDVWVATAGDRASSLAFTTG